MWLEGLMIGRCDVYEAGVTAHAMTGSAKSLVRSSEPPVHMQRYLGSLMHWDVTYLYLRHLLSSMTARPELGRLGDLRKYFVQWALCAAVRSSRSLY
jgi:hypothetical protein